MRVAITPFSVHAQSDGLALPVGSIRRLPGGS
jgi:hypothetical protein